MSEFETIQTPDGYRMILLDLMMSDIQPETNDSLVQGYHCIADAWQPAEPVAIKLPDPSEVSRPCPLEVDKYIIKSDLSVEALAEAVRRIMGPNQ